MIFVDLHENGHKNVQTMNRAPLMNSADKYIISSRQEKENMTK
jgi:hypothetical protein